MKILAVAVYSTVSILAASLMTPVVPFTTGSKRTLVVTAAQACFPKEAPCRKRA